MRLSRTAARRGVTLTEVVITVGLLTIAIPMLKLGMDWVNSISRQRVMMNAQWQAQVALYDLTRAVRNAESIVSVSSSTLVLRVLQPSEQGFTNALLFADVNRATMTFTFVNSGQGTHLLRRLESPTKTSDSKVLANMLVNPVGSSYMFHPYPPADTEPPFDAVEIVLRLWPSFMKTGRDNVIEYRSISMRRARAQENT